MSRFQSSIATLRALEKAASATGAAYTDGADAMRTRAEDEAAIMAYEQGATFHGLASMFAAAAADLEQQAAENGSFTDGRA